MHSATAARRETGMAAASLTFFSAAAVCCSPGSAAPPRTSTFANTCIVSARVIAASGSRAGSRPSSRPALPADDTAPAYQTVLFEAVLRPSRRASVMHTSASVTVSSGRNAPEAPFIRPSAAACSI